MPSETKTCLLAIDPGSEKLGLAILDSVGGIIEKSVISREGFPNAVSELINRYQPSLYAIGDGTGSDWVINVFTALGQGKIEQIPEKGTTLEARELAWRENPPGGLWRILPKIFWPTPSGLDGWAAVIIGRRALIKR